MLIPIKYRITEAEKKLWGSYLWYLIHIVAYDSESHPQDNTLYRDFFSGIGKILPCEKCQEHFIQYANKHVVKTNTNWVNWSIEYHNEVNQMVGKPVQSAANIRDLFYVTVNGKEHLPIDHHSIGYLLKILWNFHAYGGTLHELDKFLRLLQRLFPCRKCRKTFNRDKYNIEETIALLTDTKLSPEMKMILGRQKFTYD